MQLILRPYQNDAVEALRREYRHGRKSPMLVLPTGGGKTVVFSHIAEQASQKGNSVYILVHRQELLLQSSRHLASIGVPHGRVAPGHSQTRDAIQVASVQTLVRRLDYYKPPDLIVIDECHHSTAGSWQKIINAYPKALLLGVTATPCRLDGHGLGVKSGGVFDCMVDGPSIRELIDMGYLSQPIVYAPPTELIMEGVKTVAGDYERGEMEKRIDKPKITGSAVEHYAKFCRGLPALAFCATVKHAEHVADEFVAAGFRALCIDGKMSDSDRKEAIEKLGNGDLDVLTSCEIVSEGTDIPIVGAIILLRPTQSEGLHIQQCGRGLRLYPGKEHTIILDHVGNCLKHGLPDAERTWSLEGEKKSKKKKSAKDEPDVKVRQCPKCYMVHVPSPKCPSCGHVYVVAEQHLEIEEGELKQLTDVKIRERKRRIAAAKTLEELREIGKELHYKPGWAWAVFNAREQKYRRRNIQQALPVHR